ncbi:MAG: TrkA family potassium uptake protein [Chloroflexi bacterium]|nr:TrkA family potassium uptake protein [Chloroflexota bacterium]
MYIIVIGGDQAGYYLAKSLLNSGHEVLIVERDSKRCEIIREQLGSVVIRGDGCEAALQEEIGTARADVFISVTGDDEDNLVSCQVAKNRFKVARTIARIKNPKNEVLFRTLGVDVTVSSTNLILANIKRELPSQPLYTMLTMKGSPLEVISIKIPSDAPTIGMQLGKIPLPQESVICMLISKGEGAKLPKPISIIGPEDEIVVITTPEYEAEIEFVLTGIKQGER